MVNHFLAPVKHLQAETLFCTQAPWAYAYSVDKIIQSMPTGRRNGTLNSYLRRMAEAGYSEYFVHALKLIEGDGGKIGDDIKDKVPWAYGEELRRRLGIEYYDEAPYMAQRAGICLGDGDSMKGIVIPALLRTLEPTRLMNALELTQDGLRPYNGYTLERLSQNTRHPIPPDRAVRLLDALGFDETDPERRTVIKLIGDRYQAYSACSDS